MIDSALHYHLSQLKTQIESRLQWGEHVVWSKYDFEKLSEQIAEKTGVTLSVSTLKRIFGKVTYQSEPSLTTLNALAQFVCYADWREFILKNPEDKTLSTIPTGGVDLPNPQRIRFHRRFWVLIALGVICIGGFSFFILSKRPHYNPADFEFSSKTMLTQGLPNSVVFDFDASKANDPDSVFISQTWDIRRKVWVSKHDKHHSAIYYYPGYFRAKLIIGQHIIKEHDIHIKTDGWVGLINAEWGKVPLYFKPSEIIQTASVEINKELLRTYNVPLSPTLPAIRFFNQKDSRGIMTDNFIFETELKNTDNQGTNTCQRIEVLLQSKNDIMIIPIVRKECIGDIYLSAYGYYASSQQEDLSGFGCNPLEWTKLKVVCKDGKTQFYINNQLIYTAQIRNKASEIVGVQYRFNGPAAIRNTWLQGKDHKIDF